jgi:hypothetical protein
MPLTMPRSMAAALLLAGALALTAASARGAETATADDAARFLAGLPPAADSPLAALTKSSAWQQHAKRFDALFGRVESGGLAKIAAFSRAQLSDKRDTMLYMFSGPDFLYATSFFPGASTYVLSGLEPVGDIPQLPGLRRAAGDGALQHLEYSLNSILSYSFFITHKMRAELSSGPVYGTLPILYVFLARTGKTVHDVSLVSIDEAGDLHSADEPGYNARSAARGVKIVFSDGDHPNQTLYYFSTNLADGSVERSGFLTFCDRLGSEDGSLLKSASYLLHGGGFTRVRRFLLDHSATIVEDDSGIPLAYFDRKQWRLRPFGRYVGPLSIFAGHYQPQMAQLFRNANPPPLAFGVGYRWRNNESNLVVADKIAPGTAEAETTHTATPHSPPPHTATRSHRAKEPRPRRRKLETSQRGLLGCPYYGVFPFCSAN